MKFTFSHITSVQHIVMYAIYESYLFLIHAYILLIHCVIMVCISQYKITLNTKKIKVLHIFSEKSNKQLSVQIVMYAISYVRKIQLPVFFLNDHLHYLN